MMNNGAGCSHTPPQGNTSGEKGCAVMLGLMLLKCRLFVLNTIGSDRVDDRRARGYAAVAAGSEAAIQVEVLAPRDSGGLSLTMRVRLGATEPLIEEWLNASVVLICFGLELWRN